MGLAETIPALKPVVVVEDEPDLRESLKLFLETEGFEVHTASNGREALDLVKRLGKPVVVLLDLMMPVMNGWEFFKSVKAQSLPSTIVVVSAAPEGKMPDADGFVKKPFELMRILEVVRQQMA